MKAENTQVNIELKSWRKLDKQKEQPNVEPKQEPIFTIDLHDPNSPPESVLEKMSYEQQTWLSSLLRPFDMVYHICQGAYNKLNDAYQQQITETLRNFEKTLIEVQYELNSLLDEDCLSKLSQLYLRCGECKKEFERLSIKQSSAKDLADAVVAKKYDIGKNKKQDITPEYSLPQIKILYDFNQQTEELAKAKKNYINTRKKIEDIIESLNLTSTNKVLLHIIKESSTIRTPLLMQQFAFTSNVPEIPLAHTKAGIQMQIVLPSNEIIKKIFTNQSIENVLLQPFFHLETGISAGIALNDYIGMPVTIKGVLTGLRVNHLGLNIPIDKQSDSWHCGKIDYVIETVCRGEGHIEINNEFSAITPGLQFKLGGDTVRQFVFPCDTLGSVRFFTQLALRGIGAVSMTALALNFGMSVNTSKAAGIAGYELAGALTEITGLLAPERIIDIVEAVTLGIDASVQTNIDVPYLGKFGAMFMQRQNAALIVEHDIQSTNSKSKDIEIIHRSHPENFETQLKRRTL